MRFRTGEAFRLSQLIVNTLFFLLLTSHTMNGTGKMVQIGRQQCGSLRLAPHQGHVYQPLCLCPCWAEAPVRINPSSPGLEGRREPITHELTPVGSLPRLHGPP